jgi:DNA-binding response OmpR family regulator
MSLPATPAKDGKYRILVVEDDPNIARLILAILTKAGFECRYAPDGLAGLEAFKDADPHLVLLDLMMPGMDGRELCSKIREKSTVPIIMMTALNTDDDQVQGFKIGADDYVPKPFNPKLMVARVIAHLRRVYRYDSAGAPAPEEAVKVPLPAGWARCDSCGYMGPEDKFQQKNKHGQQFVMCPACQQSEHIAYSIA